MKRKNIAIFTPIDGSCDYQYLHFTSEIATQVITRAFQRQHESSEFSLASSGEFESFLREFPREQEKHLIVALGSTVACDDGGKGYAYASFDPSGRQHYTDNVKAKGNKKWATSTRFLLMRKEPLIAKWKAELDLRDRGASAKETWSKIKRCLPLNHQIRLLEEQLMPPTLPPMSAEQILRAGMQFAGISNAAAAREHRREG